MYHCYQVHCTKYPTISIHACTQEKKKPCYIHRFQYPLPFMYETKNLEPLQMDGNNPIFKTILAYTSKLFFLERFLNQ